VTRLTTKFKGEEKRSAKDSGERGWGDPGGTAVKDWVSMGTSPVKRGKKAGGTVEGLFKKKRHY